MRRRFRSVVIAVAMAGLFSIAQTSEAQFSLNFGGGQNSGRQSGSGGFGMTFGQGQNSFGLQFGNQGGTGQRGHGYSRPGLGLNTNPQYAPRQNRPGYNYNRPGGNLNTAGGGLLGNSGSSGWNNWNNTNSSPSYRPAPQYNPPSYARTPAFSAPSSNAFANSAPVARAPRPPAEPILILNPDHTATPVHYKVNEYPYIMNAGQTQQLPGNTTWTIDYHRGGNYGRQKYTLDPGKTYRFTPTPKGWALYAVNPPVPPVPGLSTLGN